jgi:hypothetical protein
MKTGSILSYEEKELLFKMLSNREAALAWDFSHLGLLKPEVSPPLEIRTVPHEAWQEASFSVPRALAPVVEKLVRERLDAGVFERCHGAYRNAFFLVGKKAVASYRMVLNALRANKVTIRDANLPPSADEFSEHFAGCVIASLVDLFSGYDQFPLAIKSRDMVAFMTSMGLIRPTRLLQGGTNSVAQFVRVMYQVLKRWMPTICLAYLDDIGVKGPLTTYDNAEDLPGIRRFVREHIQNLDKVLDSLERAGLTMSGSKSQWCMNGVQIVGFICSAEGRLPETAKIIKILEWPAPVNTTQARAFIGVCVYYRIWIASFAEIAAPIYELFRKNWVFDWTYECQEAMDTLKTLLTSAPALVTLDFEEGFRPIILAVDASLTGWGGVLMQIGRYDERRHPVRYESGHWNRVEASYDATKRECRGVLKALKRCRGWLYGVHFTLETDANVLVAQLNGSASDLPGSLLMRWIAWIRLFDFDVKHVPGKKHLAADGLSRKPRTDSDIQEEEQEEDIEEFIEAQLFSLRIAPVRTSSIGDDALSEVMSGSDDSSSETGREGQENDEAILEGYYSVRHHQYARWLTTLVRPFEISAAEFRIFKNDAVKFLVRDRTLFRRNGALPRRVVDSLEEQMSIKLSAHEQGGHKPREATYRRIADRYWWPSQYKDVKLHVKSCEQCQLTLRTRTQSELHPTWVQDLWHKVALDVVHMPLRSGKNRLVLLRGEGSGWVEGRALKNADAKSIARFIFEEGFCRHGVFVELVTDGGPENDNALVKELAKTYGMRHIITSAYNPLANGMIERGHKPIVAALTKATEGGIDNWVFHLPAVLWADRITAKVTTGRTPFYLEGGREGLLPIDLDFLTWSVLPWHEISSTADLLAMRVRQLEKRDVDLNEALLAVRRHRERGKEVFDDAHVIRPTGHLAIGNLVLLHDTKLDNDLSAKLQYRWLGPYRIFGASQSIGTFVLTELDGTLRAGTVPGSRLKKFITRASPEENAYDPRHRDDGILERIYGPIPSSANTNGSLQFMDDRGDLGSDSELEDQRVTRGERQRRLEEAGRDGDRALIPEGARFAVVLKGSQRIR